jgi:cytochrome bd-type quinol oxidase subunit 1
MIPVAATIGLGYLALILWPIAALVTGWKQRLKAFVIVQILGVALMAFWVWAVIGLSPLDPSAMMSELSVVLLGAVAFGIGWLAARLFRKNPPVKNAKDKG